MHLLSWKMETFGMELNSKIWCVVVNLQVSSIVGHAPKIAAYHMIYATKKIVAIIHHGLLLLSMEVLYVVNVTLKRIDV